MSKILILIFVVVVFILGGLLYIYNPEPVEYKNTNPSASSTPANPVFEDGTLLQ